MNDYYKILIFLVFNGKLPFHLPVEQPGRRQVGEFEVETEIPQ